MRCPIIFPSEVDKWVDEGLTNALGTKNYQDLITKAIEVASEDNVSELKDWNITSGKQFALFASGMLKWIPSEDAPGRTIYDVLCVFYFVLDKPPINGFQTVISPKSLKADYSVDMTALSQWIVDFAVKVGQFMGEPASITARSYQSFWDSPLFHMEEAQVVEDDPTGGFKSFNELFARFLKPGMRPISCPNNDAVIVYPADSTFDGCWPVEAGVVNINTYSIQQQTIIKGVPWPIAALLQDSKYAETFNGGIWMHAFLGPTDYHRQHAPISGTILEAKNILGLTYLNVIPEWDPRDKKVHLRPHRNFKLQRDPKDNNNDKVEPDAPDDPGYQFMQARASIIIQNDTVGCVAVLPIGMAQVSSVVINPDIIPQEGKAPPVVTKGQEISHFEFGGSDIVLVFEAQAKVLILGNTSTDPETGMVVKGQKFLYGEPLGIVGLGS